MAKLNDLTGSNLEACKKFSDHWDNSMPAYEKECWNNKKINYLTKMLKDLMGLK